MYGRNFPCSDKRLYVNFQDLIGYSEIPENTGFPCFGGPAAADAPPQGVFSGEKRETVGWARLKGLHSDFAVGQNRAFAGASARSKFGSMPPHRMLKQGDLWQRRSKSGHLAAVLSLCRRSAQSEPTAPACSPCADSPALAWSPRAVCPFADLWTPKSPAFVSSRPISGRIMQDPRRNLERRQRSSLKLPHVHIHQLNVKDLKRRISRPHHPKLAAPWAADRRAEPCRRGAMGLPTTRPRPS